MKLYGKNPILERIKANPKSIKRLYLQKQTDLSEIVREAKKAALVFDSVSKVWIEEKFPNAHTQGAVAEVDDFQYASFTEILNDCLDRNVVPVFLDGVTDPQNLGSIIRSLACLGGFSLVLAEYEAAHVNETVLRVASGGENYVKIVKVANIATSLKKAKEKDIWAVGALAENGKDITKEKVVFPLAVIIGSEGKGIRPGVDKLLDLRLALPMRGAALSYNAAVAAALFCYEVNRRKNDK